MSKTPVLTKKQQKSSLSARKIKTKETIRNVLASPYSKYWPLVSNEHYQILKNVLNHCLPKLLPEKVKIPWTELRKVPKSERKKFRNQYASEHLGPDYPRRNIEERDGLILGINDVTKALENEGAKYILIAEDIQPRLMVEHVIDQAVLLGTPVLVVPELRTILKEKCGISSVAVAFTDCPRYKLVQDSIEEISKNYPIPKNHINFNRSLKVADESVIIIEDSILEDISKTNLMDTTDTIIGALAEKKTVVEHKVENKEPSQSVHLIRTSKTNLMDTTDTIIGALAEKRTMVEHKVENREPIQCVHLIRTSNNKRVFIPEKCPEKPKNDRVNLDSSSFISFSADTPCKQKINAGYKSLKVLKIKGDINRTKRKMQALKERKSKQKGIKKFKNGDKRKNK